MYASRTNTPIGSTGGHVATVVPGSYDPKTNTFETEDTMGRRRTSAAGFEFRYAGDQAVQAAQAAQTLRSGLGQYSGRGAGLSFGGGGSAERRSGGGVPPELSDWVAKKENFSASRLQITVKQTSATARPHAGELASASRKLAVR